MRKQHRHLPSGSSPAVSKIRIVGGEWRSRKIHFPAIPGLRPTGDRTRETLFNWLAPVLPGAHCLDLFAGSGALGFEALSRGAASCSFVEKHPVAVRCLQENCGLLGARNAQVFPADAADWCCVPAKVCFDVVFIDPPFADGAIRVSALLGRLVESGCLSPQAWAYVEQSVSVPVPVLPGWVLYREQVTGAVRFSLWQRTGNR